MLSFLFVLSTCYLPPVTSPVAIPFEAPSCPYCAGHRGVEYHPEAGTPVRAAAAGRVTFSGVVVGIRYLVVMHADGISATYGILATTALRAGDAVVAGQIVGASTSRLYFGLRASDGAPIDPAGHLGVVTRRPRLVPIDGSPARPAVERQPSCAARAGTPVPSR